MRETTRTAVPARGRRMLTRHLPILAAAVAVLAVLGPFGTFQDLSLPARLAYWGGLIAAGTLLFQGAAPPLFRAACRRGVPWPATTAAVLAMATAVMTAAVALVEAYVRDNDFLSPAGYAELYVYVLVVSALVSAAPLWLELRANGLLATAVPPAAPATAEAPATPSRPSPTLLARLPPRLGDEVLALEMEDHYVRVHTRLGSDLVLMRMRDAVAGLEGVDGLQVHRSHWVAAAAVAGAERQGDGRITLRLDDGRRVPVSRRHMGAVRGAGWLDRKKNPS